jgi:hypothetical protein
VASEGSYWPAGRPLAAYGLWKVHEAHQAGFLILVEGESDCWALWHHGLPALGLPGCGTARTLTADTLSGVETVYVHREPDRGGAQFSAGVAARLGELGFAGQAFALALSDGVKDPADLHVADPERFKERLEEAIRASQRLEVAQPKGSRVATPAPVVLQLGDLRTEKVRWLWEHRIPFGALTVLEGDPGLGKSTLTADLAARVTRGLPMPAEAPAAGAPANVLFLNAEDSPARTLRPRLAAAGADLGRVCFLDAVTEDGVERPVGLPTDLDVLARLSLSGASPWSSSTR